MLTNSAIVGLTACAGEKNTDCVCVHLQPASLIFVSSISC